MMLTTSRVAPKLNIGLPENESIGPTQYTGAYIIIAISEPATVAGTINTVDYRASGAGSCRVLVGSVSNSSGNGTFTVKARSDLLTSSSANPSVFTGLDIPVEVGDVIGYWSNSTVRRLYFSGVNGRSIGYANSAPLGSDPAVGVSIPYNWDSHVQLGLRGRNY